MPYDSKQSGRAQYNSWMHINPDAISDITEGPDSQELKDRRYAQLVYTVNPSNLTISGDCNISGSMGLNDSGMVKLSGDQLKVFDKTLIDELSNYRDLLIQDNYSRIIQERGTDTYIAHAPPGTSTSSSSWRVQKITTEGNRLWADNAKFTQPANIELSGLSYSY